MLIKQIVNGVFYIIDDTPREGVNLEIVLTAGGSWFESPKDAGKKHLLEHCLMSRTKDLNHDQVKNWELQNNISTNAYTGRNVMGFTASGYKADYKIMLDYLLESVFTPTLDQGDLDREKQIVLREISERRGDPNYKLYYDSIDQIYTADSAEKHQTLGDSEMVAQTTLEDLHNLHSQNLSQSNILIMISGGGIDLDYLNTQLPKFIDKLDPNRKVLDLNYSGKSELLDFVEKKYIHEFGHQFVDLTIYIPCKVDIDNLAERLAFNTLFMRYGGKLYDHLRDEKQLVYGLQAWFDYELQRLVISMEAEEECVREIIAQTNIILGDFDANFDITKFTDYQKVVYKKQALDKDRLGAAASFVKNNLLTYGKSDDYDTFSEGMKNITLDQMKNLYNNIKDNLTKSQIVMVSKNPINI
jgi:predicted Zn-dependent peptidase